ncbi:MAG TPA: aldo/keto reductase [Candidatus Hydrogenedentes bacterium]|nr:aldo/keto reductase [Candidatus Hydrogenedentota bacterium]
MKRREFLETITGSAAALASGAWGEAPAPGMMPRRPLGKTGITLPVIGFSGLVARDSAPEAVEQVVSDSLAMGVNFFDTAASYGNSETMLAPFLKPRRKDIILSTKTRERTREGAQAEFNRSCEILGTDYFDMYLVHGIQHVDKDVDAAFADGGAMEYLLDLKKWGRIRCLGFSSHSTESAVAAMERYDFDFFYFPISYTPWLKAAFGPAAIDKALATNTPCIALKAMARQRWSAAAPKEGKWGDMWYQPVDDPEEASLALRWTLSRPVVAALPPGREALYRLALDMRGALDPITPDETARLLAMSEDKTPLFPR